MKERPIDMANPLASGRQSYHQNIPHPASYPNEQGNHHESLHAAEVLASFHQYPIRDTTQFIDYAGLNQDPLVQDIHEHSRDLVATLLPILQVQEGDPGTSYDINNCKGVNHIAGSMMPDDEDISRSISRSSFTGSSHGQLIPMQQHVYRSSIIKNEPSPTTPIKPETPGFQTTFQFVVNENAKEARITVRKHVMKEFRRRERWEQGQKGVMSGSIEKKTVSAKRRRRKDTPESDLPTPIEPQIPANLPPIEPRRESISQQLFSAVQLHDPSGRNIMKKRNKVLIPPKFPESRQHQLWGAVSTGFDQAIVELEGRNSGPYQHDPWSTVAVDQVDPFTKLDLDLGPATQSLLHHFAWVMPSLMDSIVTGKTFHRIGWLYSAVAIHDPTPVHVILGYTLGHIASLRGLEEPPQALEHKSKAIKLLHHRMADPEQCYSNGLIGAIVNFAGWELICANPKAYAMHMSGLGRIVTARGGMSAFEDKTGLETVIVRLDAIRAYVTQSSPRYPAFSSVRELEPVAINIPHQAGKSTWNTSNQSYTPSSYKYCEDALTLMNRIEDVLLLCRSAASDLSGPVGEPFHKLLTKSIEQMLARPEFLIDEGEKKSGDIYAAYDTRQSSTSKVPESQRHGLIKSSLALRLASLTFLDVAIREFFDSPPYPGFYTAQLTHQFLGSKAMANDTAWGRSLEMLIAVLMQADRMALERPWRAWYAADALTLTMRIGEWTWEAVGKSLRQWIEDGGLESAQPRIIEEEEAGSSPPIRKTSTTTTTNTSSVASSKNERSSDSRPRSKEFWNLKIVAGRFLEQWESSFERSNHPNPPLQRYDTEQNQQQQQQRQQQGYQAPSSQRQANQELPPPPRSTSQPTVQSQHISPMNVNESMTSVDGLPSGVSSSSTIPSPIGGEGEGAGVRNNQSSHNPPTW